MTDLRHYLEFGFAGHRFLVPNSHELLIEPRENMEMEKKGRAAALRRVQGVIWPAYALDSDLNPVSESPWTRAIFLDTRARQPVGLLVDTVRLVPLEALRIEPFTPLGPPPVSGQHLFQAAAMSTQSLTLVMAPLALAAYLRAQEGDYGLSK